MIITHYTEAQDKFYIGDEVWACDFKYAHDKESRHLYQKPILGKLMAGRTEELHKRCVASGTATVKYFVPFKKNGTELAWSKAVTVYSRKYATSKQECIKMFNELIESDIKWHENEIKALKKELI